MNIETILLFNYILIMFNVIHTYSHKRMKYVLILILLIKKIYIIYFYRCVHSNCRPLMKKIY